MKYKKKGVSNISIGDSLVIYNAGYKPLIIPIVIALTIDIMLKG